MMSVNPYRTPETIPDVDTSGDSSAKVEDSAASWRMIPTLLLFELGGLAALVGFVLLCFFVVRQTGVTNGESGTQLLAFLFPTLLFAGGVLLLAAARWCWRGRFKAAIATAALGAVLLAYAFLVL